MPQMSALFLAFTAAVVVLYWVLPQGWRTLFLALSSSLFLAGLDLASFALVSLLTALVYLSGKAGQPQRNFPFVLAALVLLFCSVRIAQLMQRTGQAQHWLVFLGFGFYTLKLLHYRIERQANAFRPHNFLEFYNFLLFFPTITIGPINRFEDFLKSSRRIRWDSAMFACGLERVLYGYAKVVIVANWLLSVHGLAVLRHYQPDSAALSLFLDSVFYGFHLYFTFAGFSDIAIGTALLLGYYVGENFNHPFLKRNIAEFWQSWHMSLSAWCRQYVFLPVYSKSRNLPIAMVAAMMTLGLWHEFSLRFLIWGAYHGTGILVCRWYQRSLRPRLPEIHHPVYKWSAYAGSIALTFTFVMVGFTIPRSASAADILQNLRILFGI